MNIFTKYVKQKSKTDVTSTSSSDDANTSESVVPEQNDANGTETSEVEQQYPSMYVITMNERPILYAESRKAAFIEIQKILNIIEYSNHKDDILIEESDFVDEFKVHKILDFILFRFTCNILTLQVHEVDHVPI